MGFVGTVNYASVNAQLGIEQCRKDDLEAVGYMLIRFLTGELPWEQSSHIFNSDKEWFDHCCKQKSLLPLQTICQGCPREFIKYMKYPRASNSQKIQIMNICAACSNLSLTEKDLLT